jgi:hypothetical protein
MTGPDANLKKNIAASYVFKIIVNGIYIVIQPQSYHTTRQISIAYSGLKQE